MKAVAVVSLATLAGIGVVAVFELDLLLKRWLTDRRRRRERGGFIR